jgi:hypothetical protein
MEPREETRLGSPLGCGAFKMAADCGGGDEGVHLEMSSLQQQVRRRFMITDILSSAAAAVVDRNRCGGDTDESGRMAQPAAALDMRLLFPNLPLGGGGGGLPERTDIETDTDNEGEEDGETDHEKGERDEGTV